MKNNKIQFLAVAAAVAALALPSVGLAQSARPISDGFYVFDPNGELVASVVQDEATEVPGLGYYINDPTLADPSQFGNYTTLLELDGSISDVFGVGSFDQQTFYLGFQSDGETGLGGGPAQIILPEGNGIFDATQYLNPGMRDAGFTARFVSDADIAGVPEPSSLLLIGLGAMTLGAYRRLSRKQK